MTKCNTFCDIFGVVCSGDKHSDRESEYHGHVCIFLHATRRCCRGGWHSYVTQQHLWSVCLSRMDLTTSALGFSKYVDLRDSHHCIWALLRHHSSHMVQCKNWRNVHFCVAQTVFFAAAQLSQLKYRLVFGTTACLWVL